MDAPSSHNRSNTTGGKKGRLHTTVLRAEGRKLTEKERFQLCLFKSQRLFIAYTGETTPPHLCLYMYNQHTSPFVSLPLTTPVWSGHLMLITAEKVAGGGDARSPASSATACTAGLGLAAPSSPLVAAAAPSPALVGVGATSSLIGLVVGDGCRVEKISA